MSDESSSSENESKNKSKKKFFVNNINSWFSRFLIDEFTKNDFNESDSDYEFMGTIDTICSKKLPEGFKPKIISLNIDNKNYFENDIFTNNIILFNLENQNFEEVEYVVKGLKCIKYKKEKTLIIISNIMTWGKSNPTKNLKDIEVKNEIALNNNCDFEEYNEKIYKVIEDNFIDDEEFNLQGKYNIWKDKFEEEKKKRKEEKERKRKEEEEAKKKVNKGSSSKNKEKKSKLRKKKKDKNENEKKSTIDCNQTNNNNNSNSLGINAKGNNNSSGENSKNSSQNHKYAKRSTKRLITKNISEEKANKINPYYYNDNDFSQRVPNYKYKNYKLIENLALSSTNPKLNVYIICPGILYGYGEDVFFEYFKNSFLHRNPIYFLGEGNNFIPTIHILDLINVVKYVIENNPSKRYIIACDRTRNPCLKNIMKSIYKSMNPYGKCNKLKNSEINIDNIFFDKYYEIDEAKIEQNNQDNNKENKNKVRFSNNNDINNSNIEINETKINNVFYIPNYNKFNIDIKIRPSKLIFGAPPKDIDKFFKSELKKKEENNVINNNIKPIKESASIMITKGSQELSVINEVNKSQTSGMSPNKTSLLINKNLNNNIKSLNNNPDTSNINNISNNKNNSNINNMLVNKNLNTNSNQLSSTMTNNMMTTSPFNTFSNITTAINLSEQFNWHCEYGIPENIEKLRNEFIQFRNLKQIKIFITGPPSSGKTYLSNYFSKKYSIPLLNLKNMIEWANLQIDNENFYKQIVDVKNKLQLELEEYEDSLVKTKKNTQDDKNKNKKKNDFDEERFKRFPDDLIISIVKERLKQNDVIASGYILDGFPKSYNDCVKLFCIEDEYKKVELGVNFTLPSEDKKSDNEKKKEKSPGNKALARKKSTKKAQPKLLKSLPSSNKLASVNSVRNSEEDGLKTDSSKPKELNKKLVPDLIFNIVNLSEEKLKNNIYFKHKDDQDDQDVKDNKDIKDNKDSKVNKGNKDNKDDKDIKHKERTKSLDRFERRYKSYKENELVENTNINVSSFPNKNNILSFFNEFNIKIFDFDYEKIENVKLHRKDIDNIAKEIIDKENEEELAKNKKLTSKITKKIPPSLPQQNDNLNSIKEEGDGQNEIKDDPYNIKMNYDTLFENYINQKGNINNKVLLTDEVIDLPIKDFNTYEHIEQQKPILRRLRRSSTYLSSSNVNLDELKGIRKREIKELNRHKNELKETLNNLNENEKKSLEKETEVLRYFLNKDLMPKIFEAIIEIGKTKPPDPVKELISYLKDKNKMDELREKNKIIMKFQKAEHKRNYPEEYTQDNMEY